MKYLLLSTLIWSAVATCASQAPLLYDAHRDRYVESEGELLPNRIYGIYSERLKFHVATLTDENGKITKPMETFLSGSVVHGPRMGAEATKYFVLTEDQRWVATKKRFEKHIFWVDEKRPFYRIVTFDGKS